MTDTETFEQLDELLSSGENKEGTDLFNSLSDEQKESYIDHRHDCFTDFSECGNWENGVPPTREEVEKDLMYIIDLGAKL